MADSPERAVPKWATQLVEVLGLALVIVGAFLIDRGLGLIVVGLIVVFIAFAAEQSRIGGGS